MAELVFSVVQSLHTFINAAVRQAILYAACV